MSAEDYAPEELFAYAVKQLKSGLDSKLVKQNLMVKGIEEEAAESIVVAAKEALNGQREFNRKQLLNTLAMLSSAGLTYIAVRLIATSAQDLAFPAACLTAITVGICCDPNTYRTRNGSLALAIILAASLWAGAVVVLLINVSG